MILKRQATAVSSVRSRLWQPWGAVDTLRKGLGRSAWDNAVDFSLGGQRVAQEIVELRGHLIDSLVLPRVLDVIMSRKACFEIQQIKVGARAQDTSFARILIAHRDPKMLETILHAVGRYGAEPVERREARLERAAHERRLPGGFYATTNLDTEVRLRGRWVGVRNPEMDCGIRVGASGRAAETIKMADVRRGDRIVVGEQGVRVIPLEARRRPEDFEFMTSEVSTEKPKGALIRSVARLMKQERAARPADPLGLRPGHRALGRGPAARTAHHGRLRAEALRRQRARRARHRVRADGDFARRRTPRGRAHAHPGMRTISARSTRSAPPAASGARWRSAS